MRAVVLLALVLCAVMVSAETEVAAAAGSTEAQADTEATANVAAAAETAAAAATTAEAAATTEAAAEATTETAAAAESEAEASAETSTETEAAAEATTEATSEAAAEKPAEDKKKEAPSKSFKPVMINRQSRRAMRSQRNDIRYTDGGRAAILSFGPRPSRPDNRVEAEIASPLRRRFARWADAIANTKQQFFTPPYADEVARQRYTSFVPGDAFFAPRRPTHFEPEYQDEHALLSGQGMWSPFVTVIGAPPRQPTHYEPEYVDEHRRAEFEDAVMNGDIVPVPMPMPMGAPFFGDYDFSDFNPIDVDDVLQYQRSVYPNNPRARPSSWQLYGLPEFPEMPASAAAATATPGSPSASGMPFSGLDDPAMALARSDFAFGVPIEYPTGSGPVASLQKLDFALDRLANLNAQLKAAEAKIASSRLRQAQAQDKLQRLNRVRANLQKLAAQVASFEAKVSTDNAVQNEVAKVVSADAVNGKAPLVSWLGDKIRFN